jgi:MFS family permease
MKQNQKSAAIGFIFITLLIDITGWGIIIPVVPKLIEELIHADISEAAKYGGWLSFAYAFIQFIFSPLVGNLSDRFGRRPIILLSLFGFSIDYIFLHYRLLSGGFLLGESLPELQEPVLLQPVLILRISPRIKIVQKISD